MPERHEVAVLALPDVVAFELGLPHRLIGTAVDDAGRPFYRVRVATLDGGPVRTSAGNAAGIDLCLHIVRRDHGAGVANRVARRSVVAPWREGGQSQFMEPVPDPDGPGTAPTRAWALERLHEPLTLADLAAHAAMSVRTFTRRF